MSAKVRDKKTPKMRQNNVNYTKLVEVWLYFTTLWNYKALFLHFFPSLCPCRSFYSIQNCIVPVAGSKISRRVVLVKNVRNFHQLFAGLRKRFGWVPKFLGALKGVPKLVASNQKFGYLRKHTANYGC